MMDTITPGTPEGSPCTIELSSNLDNRCPFCPMEETRALLEPHGAVVLFRCVSGEETERFELTGAEVETLVEAQERRRAIVSHTQACRSENAPDR
jgi:hypothetical protein